MYAGSRKPLGPRELEAIVVMIHTLHDEDLYACITGEYQDGSPCYLEEDDGPDF